MGFSLIEKHLCDIAETRLVGGSKRKRKRAKGQWSRSEVMEVCIKEAVIGLTVRG